MNPAEMPLTPDHLAGFLDKTRWAAKRGPWIYRLARRMALELLDLKTQQALAGEQKKPGFAAREELKRR